MAADLAQLRAELRACATDLWRAQWLFQTGQTPTLKLEPIYRRHGPLFSPDLIAALAGRIARGDREADGGDLVKLHGMIVQGYLDFQVRELRAAALKDPAQARVLWEATSALALDLGYPSYRALHESLTGIDYAALDRAMQALLREIPEGNAADSSEDFSVELTASLLFGAIEQWTSDLGFPLSGIAAITLDLAPSTQSPRAFTAPMRPGREIGLAIPPGAGLRWSQGVLHELGHACHQALTDPALPIEQQLGGERALSEAYAFLFEHCLAEPGWVTRYLPSIDPAVLTRAVEQRRARLVRHLAGQLHFELSLLSQPTLAPLDTTDIAAWARIRPGFYPADYLRGLMLAAVLKRHLAATSGPSWFASPTAGDQLHAWWRLGESRGCDQLATELGADLTIALLRDSANSD